MYDVPPRMLLLAPCWTRQPSAVRNRALVTPFCVDRFVTCRGWFRFIGLMHAPTPIWVHVEGTGVEAGKPCRCEHGGRVARETLAGTVRREGWGGTAASKMASADAWLRPVSAMPVRTADTTWFTDVGGKKNKITSFFLPSDKMGGAFERAGRLRRMHCRPAVGG